MLEPQDIQKLLEVLATKEDIRGVEKRLDEIEARLDCLTV
jgi:tetrahydromethanopterin S-methyltransferase subunit G